MDENPNIQNFIGEIPLKKPDNPFLFAMNKMITNKNNVYSYLTCMIMSNVCQLGTELCFQLSKNRLFGTMLDHCINCIMNTDMRLILRKEMMLLINSFIINCDSTGTMFFIRQGGVKALYHILETYNYAVTNNCAIQYFEKDLRTQQAKKSSVSGQEKLIQSRNDIFFTAINSLNSLLLNGAIIMDSLRFESGDDSAGRNPVIAEILVHELDFKFLKDRHNLIEENLNKNTIE
jgi:hypothetical protein